MDILWATSNRLNVQEVCDALGPGHNYKTVMTVLNRLVEKRLLERQLDGRAFRYHPPQSREAFLRTMAAELVAGYLQSYGSGSAAHLTGAIDRAIPRPSVERPGPPPPIMPPADESSQRPSLKMFIAAITLLQLIALLIRRDTRKEKDKD